MRLRFLLGVIAVAAALFGPSALRAEPSPVTAYPPGWTQIGAPASLSVSNSTGNVKLGWVGVQAQAPQNAWVCNTGANTAYVAFGAASTVVATASNFAISGGGSCVLLALNGASYIAGITAGSTTTLSVLTGDGTPPSSLSSGSSPPIIGTVAIDQAIPGSTNLVSAGFSQQVASTPVVQNAQYVSGNCIGGFNAITVAVNNGQSGFVTHFRVASLGGSIPTLTIYLFSSNPSASTCTDKSTFTLAAADVDKLIVSPTAITLAAPTGTSVTFGATEFTPPRAFIAGGSTGSGVATIYYGLVSGTTFTPATVSDLHTRTGVVLN